MASGADEGFGMTFSLEGDRIYASYSRLKDSGWSAAPGIPAALVEGAALRSLATYAGGVLLSVALGTFAALWVARSIGGFNRSSQQSLCEPIVERHRAPRPV